jgi:hypothetical protein
MQQLSQLKFEVSCLKFRLNTLFIIDQIVSYSLRLKVLKWVSFKIIAHIKKYNYDVKKWHIY